MSPPRTWLSQDAAASRGSFNASPPVCKVKIAASSRSSIPGIPESAPQAARKRMVLSERSYLKNILKAFWDSKDGVSMGNVFDDFVVDVLCELDSSLRSTGRADPSALTGEGDKKRVFAAITVYPSSTVSEDAAVKIFAEGF